MEPRLETQIAELLSIDPDLRDWWQRIGERGQAEVDQEIGLIDGVLAIGHDELPSIHDWCSRLLNWSMSGIPSKDLRGVDVPEAWERSVNDEKWRQQSLRTCGNYLKNLVDSSPIEYCDLYGNIKKGKAFRTIGVTAVGIWDVVRFRVVGKGLTQVKAITESLLKQPSHQCLRVRNLYTDPISHAEDTGYRAIHLILLLDGIHLFEVQIRTHRRDLISRLDHAYYSNRDLRFTGSDRMLWLRSLSYKTNLLDFQDHFLESIPFEKPESQSDSL